MARGCAARHDGSQGVLVLRDAHGGIPLPSSPPMTERDGVVAESLVLSRLRNQIPAES